jgi:hypothetical protein
MFMNSSLKKALACNVDRLMIYHGMKIGKERLTTEEVAELCKKNGDDINQKTVWNVINPEKSGAVNSKTIESIAKVFGLEPYHLLIPNLPIDELTSHRIEKMIANYAQSPKDGRENIARIAENEVRYCHKQQDKIINGG